MALPRFAKLDPAKKAMIIHVATEEFANQGYEQASLNQIITRCGISKGAFYYYFADKDDLYETIVDLFSESLLERWSKGNPARAPAFTKCKNPAEYWQEWISHFQQSISHSLKNPVENRFFLRSLQARAYGTAHPALNSVASRVRGWVLEALKQGQEIGAVRTDLPEELLIETSFGMMEGFDRWLLQELDGPAENRTDELAGLVVRFLRRIAEPMPT